MVLLAAKGTTYSQQCGFQPEQLVRMMMNPQAARTKHLCCFHANVKISMDLKMLPVVPLPGEGGHMCC